MSDKNLYINDLKHRYPDHTFEEIPVGGMTKVIFRDADSNIIGGAQTILPIDAYLSIRWNLLGWKIPVFLSSTAELDALANIDMGTLIQDLDTDSIKIFNGSIWKAAGGGSPSDAVPSLGEMYENNPSGSEIDPANHKWVTAQAGMITGVNLVQFEDDPEGDGLVIDSNGAGTYRVNFKTNFTNDGGKSTTLTILKNGIVQPQFTDIMPGDSLIPNTLLGFGYLNLVVADKVSVHIISETPSDTIKVYQSNLNIERL